MNNDKVQNFKVFESEAGTPGPMPASTKEWLGHQLDYWKEVEKAATDPKIQQKATDKVNAINAVLNPN